jgi:hypothetical protein
MASALLLSGMCLLAGQNLLHRGNLTSCGLMLIGSTMLSVLDVASYDLSLDGPRTNSDIGVNPHDALIVQHSMGLAYDLHHIVPGALCIRASVPPHSGRRSRQLNRTDCGSIRMH